LAKMMLRMEDLPEPERPMSRTLRFMVAGALCLLYPLKAWR
jgi:hypothetical protein